MDPIEIGDDRALLFVSPQGASIQRYVALQPGREPIPLLRPAEGPLSGGCQLLVPWSNRISGGGFAFDGRFHKVEPNVAGEPFPLHGNGFQKPWRLVRRTGAGAELQLDHGAIGPYLYRAHVRYALEHGMLSATLTVENRADTRLPYGLGFHPWFPRRAGTRLAAAAQHVWLEDERHLPTERVPVASCPGWDFSTMSSLPASWINNAFDGWDGHASILQPQDGIAITLEASPSLGLFILHSPSSKSGFFCFEPVSHAVDAHHRNGLTPLDPGDTMQAGIRLSWTHLPGTESAGRIPASGKG